MRLSASPEPRVVAVVGPTSSGKSDLAFGLAKALGGEILSVDSMQVYRRMDIGTGKPSPGDREAVRHHMIDIVDPSAAFSVAEFQGMGRTAVREIGERDRLPIVAGGSGLHFRAVVDPLEFPPSNSVVRAVVEALDPAAAVKALVEMDATAAAYVDLANPRRVARALEIARITGATPTDRAALPASIAVSEFRSIYPLVVLGLDPGVELSARLEDRFDGMLAAGLKDEVESLASHLGVTARQGVGYKELLPVVRGKVTLEQGRADAINATRALAKRQRTYLRRDPRIVWLPWHDRAEQRVAEAMRVLEEHSWIS